jgi:phosphoribosylaminoimidazolecarboxamide formyltransferase / IMP cyclohydrolase
MLDGRVKTLHPKVHAGLLHLRGDAEHEATMAEHGLLPIDLVCVNLYPFEATVAKPGVSFEDAIENIDIGGPAMLRSAAKNMRSVTVVTDPADYARVLAEMQTNTAVPPPRPAPAPRPKGLRPRRRLQRRHRRLPRRPIAGNRRRPAPLRARPQRRLPLRYGENPHQPARLYRTAAETEACIAHTEQSCTARKCPTTTTSTATPRSKPPASWSAVPGAAIIKHTNPCGYATGATLAEALAAAWAGDPVSAFGSVIAVTVPVDKAAADFLRAASSKPSSPPDFSPEALAASRPRKTSACSSCKPFAAAKDGQTFRQIGGGLLVQSRDRQVMDAWTVKSAAPFPEHMKPSWPSSACAPASTSNPTPSCSCANTSPGSTRPSAWAPASPTASTP